MKILFIIKGVLLLHHLGSSSPFFVVTSFSNIILAQHHQDPHAAFIFLCYNET